MIKNTNRRAMYELIQRYEHGMEAAIQMQTNLYHLRVVFEGTRAYTDGTTITLPNVRVFAMHDNITDEAIDEARAYFMALRGYAWQQAARIVESDIGWLNRWRDKRGSFAFALCSALDDIRIEHRFGDTAPGIREALEYMREQWLWPRYVRKKARGEYDVMYEMLIGLQCVLKHNDTIDDHPLWQALDPAVQSWVMRNRDDLDSAYDTMKMTKRKGTERLAEVTDRMIARWHEEYSLVESLCPVTTRPNSTPVVDNDEVVASKRNHKEEHFLNTVHRRAHQAALTDSDEPDEESQLDDIANMLTEAMKPPLLFVTVGPRITTLVSKEFAGGYVQRVEPVPPMDDKAAWDRLAPLAAGEIRTLVIHPPNPKLEKALDDAMGSLVGSMMDAAREVRETAKQVVDDAKTHVERLPEDQKTYLVYTTVNDVYKQTPDGSLSDLKRMSDEVSRYAGLIKTRLQVLLRSRTRTRWRGNREEGDELDAGAIASIAMGKILPNADLRPFRVKVEQDDTRDTVGSLLVDCSGSMRGRKLSLARQTAFCFGEVFDQAKMRFNVNAFSSRSHFWPEPYSNASEADREMYGRFGALYIEMCKGFGESWRSAACRIPQLGAYNDCNYDADSVQWAVSQLLSQRASRRVLFVLSDGLPASDEPALQQARQQRHLKNVVAASIKQGVEIVGFGICDESVRLYYPNNVVIQSASELPKVVMHQMEFLLLNAQRRR